MALNDTPNKNVISDAFLSSDKEKKCHFENMLKQFLEKFVFRSYESEMYESDEPSLITPTCEQADRIEAYALNFVKHFLLLEDLRDAVKEGNGPRLETLSKVLLLHFKSVDGFNSYAIEMLTNISHNNMLLSQRLSNQCIWTATASWKGCIGKNMEIDLLQENPNCDQKNLVRSMGANKTEKAITRASKASGGITEIVDNFDTIPVLNQFLQSIA